MSTHMSNHQPHQQQLSPEIESLLRLGRLTRRGGPSRESYFCVVGLGVPASGTLLDHGAASLLPAALAIAALLAAFVIMARRWGFKPSTAPTADEVLARLETSWGAIALDITPAEQHLDGEHKPDLMLRD